MATNIEQKIAKLWSLAEDSGATEAEAANAMAQAEKLCLRYHIDLAAAVAAGKGDDVVIRANEAAVSFEKAGALSGTRWRSQLGSAVAKTFGGRMMIGWNMLRKEDGTIAASSNDRYNTLFFVGEEQALRIMVDTFHWLETQAELAAKEALGTRARGWDGKFVESAAQFREGFCLGWSQAVIARLYDVQQAQKGSDNLPEPVRKVVDDYMQEHYPNLGRARSTSRRVSHEGMRSGSAAGARADIGRPKVNHGSRGSLHA